MKKRIISFVMLALLYLGMASAGQLQLEKIDREINFSNSTRINLATKGIQDYSYYDQQDDDVIKRCFIADSAYKIPCLDKVEKYIINCTSYGIDPEDENNFCLGKKRTNKTPQEILDELKVKEKAHFENIGNVIEKRKNKSELQKVREGQVTIQGSQIEIPDVGNPIQEENNSETNETIIEDIIGLYDCSYKEARVCPGGLSNPNSEGLQTRCYLFLRIGWSTCNTGWHLI